jgi:hypothetical protein
MQGISDGSPAMPTGIGSATAYPNHHQAFISTEPNTFANLIAFAFD